MNTSFFHSLRLSDGTWLFPKAFPVRPLASFNQKHFSPQVWDRALLWQIRYEVIDAPFDWHSLLQHQLIQCHLGSDPSKIHFPGFFPSEIDDSWLLD